VGVFSEWLGGRGRLAGDVVTTRALQKLGACTRLACLLCVHPCVCLSLGVMRVPGGGAGATGSGAEGA
jgi:hypothetical protein